jgi:L-cysteine S-thiosulfotransferase
MLAAPTISRSLGELMKKKPHLVPGVLALALLATACSKSDHKPLASVPHTLQASVKWTGEALFIERCRDCHRVHETGGVVGPDLSSVGAKRSREFLEQVVRDPSKLYPGTVMPPYDTLPADQIELLADYLGGLK